MRDRAGPSVLLGPADNLGAKRIPLDISDCVPEMVRPEHASKVSILPKMTGAPDSRIVVLRVASMNSAQEYAQGIVAQRHGHEMHVIRHQAPRQKPDFGVG